MNRIINKFFSLLVLASIFSHPTFASVENILKNHTAWTDETGNSYDFSTWKNKSLVLSMIYTDCKKVCPNLTMSKLKEIQKELDTKKLSAEFIIVTYDPEHDTSPVLSRFKKHMEVDLPNWHFLHGSKNETRDFAKELKLEGYWRMDEHIKHEFKIVYFDASNSSEHLLNFQNRDVKTLFVK